jgi:hypothetical protein
MELSRAVVAVGILVVAMTALPSALPQKCLFDLMIKGGKFDESAEITSTN